MNMGEHFRLDEGVDGIGGTEATGTARAGGVCCEGRTEESQEAVDSNRMDSVLLVGEIIPRPREVLILTPQKFPWVSCSYSLASAPSNKVCDPRL